MAARLRLAAHVSHEEMFRRFRAAEEPTARSHWQVLWMVSQGFRTEDISDAVGYSPTWIRKLVGRYNAGGAEAMGDGRRRNPGAEPLLSVEGEAALRAVLEKDAAEGDMWTGPRVAEWMSKRLMSKRLGRPVSRWRGAEALRRLGYSPQRPRPAHDQADPEAQATFQERIAGAARRRRAGISRGQG